MPLLVAQPARPLLLAVRRSFRCSRHLHASRLPPVRSEHRQRPRRGARALPSAAKMERLGPFRLVLPPDAADDAPLVVVLGWYGAQDRHLAKYSGLLEKRGIPTVRGVLPGSAVFSPVPLPRRRFAARLLELLAAMDPQGQRKVVFYIFSNGGAFVLEQVDSLLQTEPRFAPLKARVAGCVFDSAPCYMHPWVGAKAIGQGLSLPLRLVATLIFYLTVLAGLVLSPGRPRCFWHAMQNLRLGPKRLVLYSADDPLCDVEPVDELVATWRRQLGEADVAAVRWERSEHVAHLRQHTKQYMRALFGFLESAR